MSTTLSLFWDLSSNTKSSRIDASVKLIGVLEQFQTNFKPSDTSASDSGEDEEEEKRGEETKVDLEKLNASDVAYSIRRLIRGLASPRESSRLGFAVALTELLSRLNSVTASQILSLIVQHSQTNGSMKGQEERDMLFARLFGVAALAQSRLLFRSSPLANSSMPQCTAKEFQDAFEILLVLSKKKSFLKEPSFWTIVLCLRALNSSTVEWKNDMFTHVIEHLVVQDKSWPPEKLAIVLVLQDLGVHADWKTLLSPTFKNEDILSLCKASLTPFRSTYQEVDIEEGESVKSQGNWKPQLHFVWGIILDIYFPLENTQSNIKHKASFPEFFKVVVDDSLLSATSSDGRKLWGFELFRLSSSKVSPSDLPRLFTPNFMRSWVNHLSKPDRYLHKAAKLVASSLPPIITSNPTAGFPVLLQLLQTHGQFDRLTRTKTVESLLAAMDLSGVERYIQHLIELAQKPDTQTDDEDPTSMRIWVFDQFHMLIRNNSIPQNDVWVTDVLNFLLLHGSYTIRKVDDKSPNRLLHHVPEPEFSDEARRVCRSRLLTCLAELTSRHTVTQTDGKSTRSAGCASDGELWVSKVLQQSVSLNKDAKHVTRIKTSKAGSDENAQLEGQVLKALRSVETIPSDKKHIKDGFQFLLTATWLHHLLGENVDNSEDIEVCITNIERLLPKSSKSPKKKKKQTSDENDEPSPIAALVDTLIGYLDKSTSFLRTVSNQSFTFLTSLVDRESIDLILAQLERRDPREEVEEELMEVDDDDDDVVSEKSRSENESDSEDEGGEDEDEEDEENVEDDPELRKKIEEAFGTVGLGAHSGNSDNDSASGSDEEPMNDEQMFQLDEQLADIFRSRSKAKGDLGAQREATHFKNRVLDLVDIYLRKEPTSEHAPVFITPLVRVLLGAGIDEKHLTDKVISLLRNRYGKAKAVPPSTDVSVLEETLQELHAIARKSPNSNVKEVIPICNMYIVRVTFSDSSLDGSFVHRIYLDSLKDFASRKASLLQPSFFHETFRRYPSILWTSRKELLELAQNAVKGYREAQIFNFLPPMFNQFSALNADGAALVEFIKELQSAFQSIITKACETDFLNVAHMKEMFKAVLKVARQTERIIKDELQFRNAWDAAVFDSLNEKLQNSKFKSNSSLINMLRQLSSLTSAQKSDSTGGKKKEHKKRKAEDSKTDPSNAHKKKVKKNVET